MSRLLIWNFRGYCPATDCRVESRDFDLAISRIVPVHQTHVRWGLITDHLVPDFRWLSTEVVDRYFLSLGKIACRYSGRFGLEALGDFVAMTSPLPIRFECLTEIAHRPSSCLYCAPLFDFDLGSMGPELPYGQGVDFG